MQLLNTSGNQDQCYYNFKCAYPLSVLSAFNNIWSNIGYVILGLFFLFVVWCRNKRYTKRQESDADYVNVSVIIQSTYVWFVTILSYRHMACLSTLVYIMPWVLLWSLRALWVHFTTSVPQTQTFSLVSQLYTLYKILHDHPGQMFRYCLHVYHWGNFLGESVSE